MLIAVGQSTLALDGVSLIISILFKLSSLDSHLEIWLSGKEVQLLQTYNMIMNI